MSLFNSQVTGRKEKSRFKRVITYVLFFFQSKYDGLFLSNGPGDPVKCAQTVDNLRNLLKSAGDELKPIFGICLGHQLLGVAAGGKTYKLK